MTERQRIIRSKRIYEMNGQDLIDEINDLAESNNIEPEDIFFDYEVEYDYGDSHRCEVTLSYYSLETQAEFDDRIKREKVVAVRNEEYERKQYEALKAKFG